MTSPDSARRAIESAERDLQRAERLIEVAVGVVARKLGVNPRTVRRWCESGKCDYRKTVGGRRLIPITELRRLEKIIGPSGHPPI